VPSVTTVTLLNASYEPLTTVTFQHAVKMLFREVAIVEEARGDKMIGPHPWPKVIRLIRYVATKWLYRPAAWTRHGVLVRDHHRCAYCGAHARTIDHILPESRGGTWSWLNNVAACAPCNGRKGNHTPEEAGMQLLVAPYTPTRAQLIALQRIF
jgi:5-methylcytosine-specific restriction endonuclease McrA